MEKFFERLGYFIVRRRRLLFVLLGLLTIFLGFRVAELRFDNSSDIWLEKDNPALRRLNEFRAIFGNEDFVYLTFLGQDYFEPKVLALLKELEEDLRENLPYVKNIRWIGEAEFLEGRGEELTVFRLEDFFSEGLSPRAIKKRVLAEKNYQNFLFDSAGEVIAMSVDFTPYPKEVVDPPAKVHKALEEILARQKYQELKPLAVGPPILHAVYNHLSLTEAIKFLALGLLIMCLILYFIGRSVKDALVPLAIILVSLVWAFGLTELFGFTLNIYAILLPILLCCATVGDSMHVIELYRQYLKAGETPERALILALSRSGAPCLITSLTSCAGFLSFLTSDIPPCQQMGVYASIGVMTAYVLSVFLVPMFYAPAAKAPLVVKPHAAPWPFDVFDRFLAWVFRVNVAAPKVILLLFGVLFVLAFWGYFKVEAESNTIGMLSKALPLRQAYDIVDLRLGGAMSLELTVDSFAPEGVKDPDFLAKVASLSLFLEARPEVTRTISLVDLLKTIGQALHEGDEAFYAIPKTREAVAQYLLLYELADGRELDKLMSFDGQKVRLTAKTKSLDTQKVRALTLALEAYAREIFGRKDAVTSTGGLDWTRSMNDQIAKGQRQTFLAAFITLTIIMALATRSLKVGFLSLAPNVIPVLATIGFAGAVGAYVDIPLLCFCPIIISLVVDDTTHFLHGFRRRFLVT
ncbi:MAG: MMPL family transporter, partial [Deltaproteobacteria bacterium]|nr:MMPL family transporter [Deltaproteobacteria bacterium]